MTVVAEFAVPVSSFPLGREVDRSLEWPVEIKRTVPTSDAYLPFVWVWGENADEFADLARDLPAVDSVELLDRLADGALFRVTWAHEGPDVFRELAEADLVTLEASTDGHGDEWSLRVRADDRASVATFRSYCADNDIEVDLRRLTELAESPAVGDYGLTPGQREALLSAFAHGYFDEPRTATLHDVAEELGVSRQAVAARLRRAYRNLVAHTVASGTE
jgi:predicted DNA binding protein